MHVVEKRVEAINSAIFLNCPAFPRVMSIGKILNKIVGGAVAISIVGGIIYTGVAVGTIWIQDTFFYDFGG